MHWTSQVKMDAFSFFQDCHNHLGAVLTKISVVDGAEKLI